MNLNELMKKAADMIAANKARKEMEVLIKPLEKKFKFCALTRAESTDILQSSGDNDELFIKRYIYNSCDELRKIAVGLFDSGKIADYADIVDILSEQDANSLFSALVALRTNSGESEIEISELKN